MSLGRLEREQEQAGQGGMEDNPDHSHTFHEICFFSLVSGSKIFFELNDTFVI